MAVTVVVVVAADFVMSIMASILVADMNHDAIAEVMSIQRTVSLNQDQLKKSRRRV